MYYIEKIKLKLKHYFLLINLKKHIVYFFT